MGVLGVLRPPYSAHAIQRYATAFVGVPADLGLETVPVLFHELVHVVLFGDPTFSYPSWYREGLAELLSTASFRGNIVTIGAVPMARKPWLARTEPLPLARLLSGSKFEGDELDRFYADSWAFVRFLHGVPGAGASHHHREMLDFLARLDAGVPWRVAFDASFDVSLDQLEQEYSRFRARVATGISPVLYLPLEDAAPEVSFSPISPAEAAMRLAEYAVSAGRAGLAVAFCDDVLQADPENVEAVAGRAVALADLGMRDEARAALNAIPGSSLARPVVLEARGDVQLALYFGLDAEQVATRGSGLFEEAVGSYRKALEADPNRASAWVRLAHAHAYALTGDPGAGSRAADPPRGRDPRPVSQGKDRGAPGQAGHALAAGLGARCGSSRLSPRVRPVQVRSRGQLGSSSRVMSAPSAWSFSSTRS